MFSQINSRSIAQGCLLELVALPSTTSFPACRHWPTFILFFYKTIPFRTTLAEIDTCTIPGTPLVPPMNTIVSDKAQSPGRMIPHLIVRSRTQLTKDNIVFLPPEVVIEKHFQKAKPFDLSVANDRSSIMTTWGRNAFWFEGLVIRRHATEPDREECAPMQQWELIKANCFLFKTRGLAFVKRQCFLKS